MRFQRDPDGKARPVPSGWAKMWKNHPERMERHLERLNQLRDARSEARGRLLQAVLDVMPTSAMDPWVFRAQMANAWVLVYGEEIDQKKAWVHVRAAMRRGMIARDDQGRMIARQSK